MMKKFFSFLIYTVLFFPLMAFGKEDTNFKAGRDYLEIPASASSINLNPKNKVMVIEFFSYGCPACSRLNPTLETWLKNKPNHVEFDRVPVEFESDWHLYARTYYVAKILGVRSDFSPVIFDAIHKDHLDLGTPERMADFFRTHFKIKTADFLSTLGSPVVDAELANNQKVMNDFMVFQIPGIVIDGKYKVDPSLSGNNPHRLIETINYLIHEEKQEKKL